MECHKFGPLMFIIVCQAMVIMVLYQNGARYTCPIGISKDHPRRVVSVVATQADARDESSLLTLGTRFKTDKVFHHHYEVMYEKYFSSYRNKRFKFLEIGLGCGQMHGTGASAKMWRAYFGLMADIHFIEFDKQCGEEWHQRGDGKQVCSFIGTFSHFLTTNPFPLVCAVAQRDDALR